MSSSARMEWGGLLTTTFAELLLAVLALVVGGGVFQMLGASGQKAVLTIVSTKLVILDAVIDCFVGGRIGIAVRQRFDVNAHKEGSENRECYTALDVTVAIFRCHEAHHVLVP